MTHPLGPQLPPPPDPGSSLEVGAEMTAEFCALLDQAQSDSSDATLPRLHELIAAAPPTSELAVKLRMVEMIALIFGRRLDEAIKAATATAELAGRAGFPGWQADAIGQRAMAHWESNDQEATTADLILAEAMIEAAEDGGPGWNGARTSIAAVYVECGYYELAVKHFAVAATADRGSLTGRPGHLYDAWNLGLNYLRWTFDDERAGVFSAGDPRYEARLRQAQRWYEVAHQRSGGPSHRWFSRLEAGLIISRTGLDPAAHIDELAGLCQADLDPDAENDRILEVVWFCRFLRRLDRTQESIHVADRLLSTVDSPNIWRSTVREVLDEVHEAQLAGGVVGAVQADRYLRALRRELCERRASSLTAYRIRRDLAVLAARQARSDLLVNQDPLTGLGNRRALSDWTAAHPVGPVTVAMIDLDGFKEINDQFGHPAGDQILIQVAAALRASCGAAARLIRYGGDEFVVLTDTTPAPAALAASLTDGLITIDTARWAPGLRLAATVGIAQAGPGEPSGQLLEMADADLIRGKA